MGWNGLSGETRFVLSGVNIMIDCHKSIEREDLWKAVNRKEGVKRGKAGRKERQGGWENFS